MIFYRYSIVLFISLLSHSVFAGDSDWVEITNDQNLIVQDIQGEFHNLSDYAIKDKWLVVIIWQSDCHVCNAESETYINWYEKNISGDRTLIGISTDGWEHKDAAQAFIDRNKVSYPNALISYNALNKYYLRYTGNPFTGTPTFLIYSPDGVLKIAQMGAVPTQLIDDYINKNK